MNGRKQIPTNPDNWLYQDWDENTRVFGKEVWLADNADEWAECTNEEKDEWERQHQPDEPIND